MGRHDGVLGCRVGHLSESSSNIVYLISDESFYFFHYDIIIQKNKTECEYESNSNILHAEDEFDVMEQQNGHLELKS